MTIGFVQPLFCSTLNVFRAAKKTFTAERSGITEKSKVHHSA
jgi:hypothetical protein